jgi:sugar (pentulose or hexulose) kinase
MGKYVIGIDGGSQSTKIVVYDLHGNTVCEGKENLKPMHLAPGGIVEHPGDDLWDSLCIAARRAMDVFQGDQKDIIGIGVGSIRCCRALLRADGSLAAPVISWQDERVTRPYEHGNNETAYVTSTAGYLLHRLTGVRKDNIANYFGQWPVNFAAWKWSDNPEDIRKFQIPREMLFDTVLPGTVAGTVAPQAAEATGFPSGLPVIIATSDKPVEALGAGLLDESEGVISLGTYIALMIMGRDIPRNPVAFWPIMSSIPHKLIYEGYGIRRGMWTVSWFRELLGESPIQKAKELGISTEDYLNREAKQIPAGSDGLMTILDWLANPWEPFKRGIMIGFGAHMNFAYLYRSILEGIAYTLKNNFDAMCRELCQSAGDIIITGGGSNSDLFMQIFADVFNLPAKRNEVNGSASLGAAINTAVAMGAYAGYEEAVRRMVRVRDVFYPKPENVEIYERLNQQVYKLIPSYTDGILKKSHEFFNANQNLAVISGWSQT